MWRVVAWLSFAGLFSVARTSSADAPPVHLDVSACPRLDAASVHRIFAADLGMRTTSPKAPDVTHVDVSCEGARVFVKVHDPLSKKSVRRSFDSRSFGNNAEARLVALAASELVLASWAELAANPRPQVPAEGPTPNSEALETARRVVRARVTPLSPDAGTSPPRDGATPGTTAPSAAAPRRARAARRTAVPAESDVAPPPELASEDDPSRDRPSRRSREPPARLWRATAVASVRSFLGGAGTLAGGGARIGEERHRVVSWAVDALIENGELWSSRVTSASTGGWLVAYRSFGPVTLRAGAGLRAGFLTTRSGTQLATWGWPLGATSFTLRAGPFVTELAGETGFGVLPLRGPSQDALRGWWLSGQFGIGMVL